MVLLNTRDFSTAERPVPQNRERVFIIGHSRTKRTRKVFPIRREATQNRIKVIGNTNSSGWRRGESCVILWDYRLQSLAKMHLKLYFLIKRQLK